MHYWYSGGSTPWGMWVAMAVMMAIFMLAAAWVVVTLVRHSAPHQPVPPPTPPTPVPSPVGAAAILDERFARGEIDADEYTNRRALLRDTAEPRG